MGRARFLLWVLAILSCPLAWGQTDLRGWSADGQTWLVWTNNRSWSGLGTYDIYTSKNPIVNLNGATLVGRIFPPEWGAERMKEVDPQVTWKIPDGQGGRRTLLPTEALFVATPHQAGASYFAVVKHGETTIRTGASVGPIFEVAGPVQCHPQLTGTTSRGYNYTIYALWVDGRADENSGGPDFPVMGNAGANGTSHLFTVYEPLGGRPPGLLPASLQFHGGKGSHWAWRPGETDTVDNEVDGGFVVALDDALYVARNVNGTLVPTETKPFWFGYWKGFDRFQVATTYPPAGSLVVDYSLRRVEFVIRWLLAHYPMDPDRLSAMGHSMGAGAVSWLARRNPELISAGMAFGHAYSGMPEDAFQEFLMGTKVQNLPTTFPGGLGVTDLLDPVTTVPGEPDRSFIRYLWGRNDPVILWNDPTGDYVPSTLQAVEDARTGEFFYWDERAHHRADWVGQYWDGSPRLSANEMVRHRASRSFPAISSVDHAPEPGTQPDPGDGDPAEGDPGGTWGGHFDWDTETVTDAAKEWGATLFLIGDSVFPRDIPANDSAVATITIRKAALFKPTAGTKLFWTLRRPESGTVEASGLLTVPAGGVVTLPGLTFHKDPERRRLVVSYSQDTDGDGFDAQIDCDETKGEVWAAPGEVLNLRWSADRTALLWDLPGLPGGAPTALRYDVFRSPSPAGFADAAECLETDSLDRQSPDGAIPAPASARFYLVRAENTCGPGNPGTGTDGLPRPVPSCP